ncbi:MAG: GAF domain-containing protein [Bacteroidales bacterium]
MRKLLHWYRHLSLRKRFVFTFNLVLFATLALISIPALLNRVNNQYTDANNLLFPNLEELGMILNIAGKENLEDYKPVFYRKQPYNTGYASLISADGTLLIDPLREGTSVAGEEFFPKMRAQKRGRITYHDRMGINGRQKKHKYFVFDENLNSYLTFTIDHKELIGNPLKNTSLILIFALIFSAAIFTTAIIRIARTISKPLVRLQNDFSRIGRGELPEIDIRHKFYDELGHMIVTIKAMLEGLRQKLIFANEIGKHNFQHSFTPLSNHDELGNSLMIMRDSIQKAAKEEELRKKEDEKRNWSTQGLARFGDILRQNHNNMSELSYHIIKNVVKYLDANQGGVFILNDTNPEDLHLELTSCYAFDRRKYLQKRIEIGEGLVGTCFREQQTTVLTDIPRNYLKITSGLGDDAPGCLMIIPLKLNETTLGVMELASFHIFEKYQIEFLEKLAESIASAITSTKTSQQTQALLAQSQSQAEEMRAQEEEMRQNMEELTATQEEAERKNMEMETMLLEYQQKERQFAEKMRELAHRLREKAQQGTLDAQTLDQLLEDQ